MVVSLAVTKVQLPLSSTLRLWSTWGDLKGDGRERVLDTPDPASVRLMNALAKVKQQKDREAFVDGGRGMDIYCWCLHWH